MSSPPEGFRVIPLGEKTLRSPDVQGLNWEYSSYSSFSAKVLCYHQGSCWPFSQRAHSQKLHSQTTRERAKSLNEL